MLRSHLPHPEFDPPKSEPLNCDIIFPRVAGQLAQGSSKCKEQHFSIQNSARTHLTDGLHKELSAQLSSLTVTDTRTHPKQTAQILWSALAL